MKILRTDAHDRFEHFTKKEHFDIGECCQDLINKRPFGDHAFYIFAHTRTDEDGVTKRLIWQPRLTRPKPQTNSMLFKGYPGSDNIKVIWMIPARELWNNFAPGQMTYNATINQSIHDFQHNRELLEQNEKDDLSDEVIDQIYRELSADINHKKMMDSLYVEK
jgi:hypothetical protein